MKHGISAYTDGCRCDVCRLAGNFQRKKHKVQRSRGVVFRVDATETRRKLRRLHRQITWGKIGQLTGLSEASVKQLAGGRRKNAAFASAQAISALYDDYFGELELEKDDRRYPVEPLEEHLRRRFSVDDVGLGDVWRNRLSKGRRRGISAESADLYACELDLEPSQLWLDYGLSEAV